MDHRLLSGQSSGSLSPLQVYLRPYKLEEYESLVRPLGLWPFPRGHQRHLTALPIRGATLLLADQRACPALPAGLRIAPHQGLTPTTARRATDCNAACRSAILLCLNVVPFGCRREATECCSAA